MESVSSFLKLDYDNSPFLCFCMLLKLVILGKVWTQRNKGKSLARAL